MARFRKKVDVKQIVVIVLLVAVALGALVGITKLVDGDRTVMGINFVKGGLTQGLHVESDESIYLKDAIEINNLKIERDFDANIQYKIVFYDENKEYVGETDLLSANWNIEDHAEDFETEGKFAGAEFCRIVVEPIEDENGKISSVEVLEYAGQLTITYTK